VGRSFSRWLLVGAHLVQIRSHRVKIENTIKAKARIRFNAWHEVCGLSLTRSVTKIVRNMHLCTSETR
jgi:hypothetical protein